MTVPAKATHRQTRHYDRRLVLRTLCGPVSRAEVARLTGLNRTTFSDVVGNSIHDGMADEARTHVCTYSVLPDSLEALGSALLGRLEPSGTLPVPLGDLYPVGQGR